MKKILQQLIAGTSLTRLEAIETFKEVLGGGVPESMIGALLAALAAKGETVDELVGAAEAMRAAANRVRCDRECIDTCGTGGDGISTFNASTLAAIIAAAAGAVVAKHGNRSATRASGSTDVLEELGIDVTADRPLVERCLAEVGIAYLNAPLLHPAMKYAAPVRRALQVRTIFNLLGPLTNPAGARRQLLGVPHPDLLSKMAEALLELGAHHAWVVHGSDGLCDVTITGNTTVVEVRDGRLRHIKVSPEDAGLSRGPMSALRVGSAVESAGVIRGILAGAKSPGRDHALMNAGAALVVAGLAGDLREGVSLAARAVDSGAAGHVLSRWQGLCPRASIPVAPARS